MHIFKVQSIIRPSLLTVQKCSKRNLWAWLNIMFNNIDEERRKLHGPNRTCAEWLLRNGAALKWTNTSDFLKDYNELPLEELKSKLYIKEVDATDSSISHYGFGHFVGCNYIDTIVLHHCSYIEDQALKSLEPLKKSLRFLRVSSCGNITDTGMEAICVLNNLEKLIFGDLPYLKNKDNVIKKLNEHLPKCHITFL